VGIAAWLSYVPIALLEINSIPGSANKVLARFAKKVFLAYPESKDKFPKRISESATVCGTPVRAGLGDERMTQEGARQAFGLDAMRTTILVFGGSLGARAINDAMLADVGTLAERGYNILWQTGKSANLTEIKQQFIHNPNVHATDYIYNMDEAYRAADIVVCRAGASSLAELARLGKPAVLIPWSGAMDNHQEHNARAFERDGSALVLTDVEVKSKLADTILTLLNDPNKLRSMAEAMHRRDHPEAATVIAQWLMSNM
jgi:UDP-N-acetylglucosamine--N-acetylmuramyl-(pentapeptide) pyrophosphoryl-undecaprenol N-acetylglucosamine transferase